MTIKRPLRNIIVDAPIKRPARMAIGNDEAMPRKTTREENSALDRARERNRRKRFRAS